MIENLTFDEWLFEVCEHLAIKNRTDISEIYSTIDLYDANLCWKDGLNPRDYNLTN